VNKKTFNTRIYFLLLYFPCLEQTSSEV